MNVIRKCATCGARRIGHSPRPCCTNPRLRRVARAKSPDLDLDSVASGALPPPPYVRKPPALTAAERAALVEEGAAAAQTRPAQAPDPRLRARFGKLVSKVLDKAGGDLPARQLMRLRQEAKSLRRAYTQQPQLPEPDPQRKRRLKALFRLYKTLDEAIERMTGKLLVWGPRTGCFDIRNDWREQWYKLLLAD